MSSKETIATEAASTTEKVHRRRASLYYLGLTFLPIAAWLYISNFELPSLPFFKSFEVEKSEVSRITRDYHLTAGPRWMNPDGGRWRVMFVCNGQSPCPLLYAEEGDIVRLSIKNDLALQSSLHWSGISHKQMGNWNDGVGGINQFPLLPRGNFTQVFDTSNHWGLSWYAEHTTAASVDGLYGLAYVAPSPSRPRPYSLITSDAMEERKILEAERNIRHLVIKNHMHRGTDWKLLKMRATGSEFYCYDSILVNGKGRVHCRHPDYDTLNGKMLDESGCIQPEGLKGEGCTPTEADFEVIETRGEPYVMINLLNTGFEHSVKVSIDGHRMWVVANDGGFTEPYETDVVYVTNAARATILVKLDAIAGDYAMRIASTSIYQHLYSYAIIRYPKNRYPVYGEPMKVPEPLNPEDICLRPDSSVPSHCHFVDSGFVPPYPEMPPPESADRTLTLGTGVQDSKTEKFVPEFYLNKKPWQIFRAAMNPLLFHSHDELKNLEDPIIGNLPIGTTVDIVIRNGLNETTALYKHGEPTFILGSAAHSEFKWNTVEEALRSGEVELNLKNPARVVVHDLPPAGWSVLRFKIDSKAVTLLHSVKVRHFVLGMTVPIYEGITQDDPIDAPAYATGRPHVEFEPKNDGIFG